MARRLAVAVLLLLSLLGAFSVACGGSSDDTTGSGGGIRISGGGLHSITTSTIAANRALAGNGGPTQTHALLCSNSPAIDLGSPGIPNIDANACLPGDSRGALRPQDGNDDTGTGAQDAPFATLARRFLGPEVVAVEHATEVIV